MDRRHFLVTISAVALLAAGCESIPSGEPFDTIIRGGTVFDGTGAEGRVADVGIVGDRVAAIGDLSGAVAARTIDASGMAVAPGFINVLSWANESLLHDGRSQSDIRQGVTLEVMGEGDSMGPLYAGAEGYRRQAAIATSSTMSIGRRLVNIWSCSNGAACRRTSPRSSVRRRCARMSLA